MVKYEIKYQDYRSLTHGETSHETSTNKTHDQIEYHTVSWLMVDGSLDYVAIMIHRIFVSIIIIVVVSCCKICDAFVVKPYLQTNSLQKKHSSNRVDNNICKHSSPSSKLHVVNNNRGIELSNVFYDDTDMAFSAWEWQNGLGELCVTAYV